MKDRYLEVTFRKGKPLAAYLYLPRIPRAKIARTEIAGPGILVDFSSNGTPIGLEITDPARVTIRGINRVMKNLGLERFTPADLRPLRAA